MNQVLVVDDEAGLRTALEVNFRRHGWNVATASGAGEAVAKFRCAPCPLVITDMRMPDGNGLDVLQGVRALMPQTAVIFLTAYGNVPEAVTAMKEGACDYLVKPVSFDQLQEAACRILETGSNAQDDPAAENLVGSSPAFRRAIQRAQQVARTEVDILVEAESGTGKEPFARMIHRHSLRRDRPFVAINCAAFPDTLLESELFGHMRGAFTGAIVSKPGKFELANGGTLLLDEVGEMPIALQPKLLRVLQEREVDRLGDTHPKRVDVRIIATTNRSIPTLVEEGKFRADLYYRLNVVPMTIPPLRERREDIPELARHFLGKYASRMARQASVRLSEELLERLQEHDWPGNVRELENLIRRGLALATGPVIGPELLEGGEWEGTAQRKKGLEAGLSLDEMEKALLERTLEATGGNRTHAAEMLGVSLRTVRNKIRLYGLPARNVI
jgi:DNA-binding NtrC family response regulator